MSEEQKKELEFEKWFDTIQTTNIDLNQLVNWAKIQDNLLTYEKDLNILNSLICVNQEELNQWIEKVWQENPQSFQILPYLLAVRDNENFAWLEQENIEYWEELNLEKVKKLIFASGLAEYLTNGQIKNLKDYYLETSFFNVAGSKVQEVIRSYSGTVLKKAQNNEINFLWILDGKGLKSCKELLRDTYLKNKEFMFTIVGFREWLAKNPTKKTKIKKENKKKKRNYYLFLLN